MRLVKRCQVLGGEQPTRGRVDAGTVDAIVESWGAIPKKVAGKTIERYGLPNEATDSRLIWFENGIWKRTIVYRDEIPHNFPKPHTDVLEQFVDYRVPLDKFSDVARYDGSVVVERTKGEVSARCDMEEMNLLALNLMHDIATGRRPVEEARRFYAETAAKFMTGQSSPYTDALQFAAKADDTADPDETTMAPVMRGMAEGIKDAIRD